MIKLFVDYIFYFLPSFRLSPCTGYCSSVYVNGFSFLLQIGSALLSALSFLLPSLRLKHQPPSTLSSFLTISAARFLLPPIPTTTPLFDSRSRKSVFPLLLRQPLPFSASGGTDKNETTGQEEESSTGSVNAVNTTNSNDGESLGGMVSAVKETVRPEGFVIFIACGIGLLTGIAVVLFNNTVHELHDLFWDGIPSRGASWLRHEPVQDTWQRTVLVPAFGGLVVGILNDLRGRLEIPSSGNKSSKMKGFLRSFMKTIAAAVSLGTGNSLGPEGPSVEIGTSIARGIGVLFKRSRRRNLSFVASGSAAGISSGSHFPDASRQLPICLAGLAILIILVPSVALIRIISRPKSCTLLQLYRPIHECYPI